MRTKESQIKFLEKITKGSFYPLVIVGVSVLIFNLCRVIFNF